MGLSEEDAWRGGHGVFTVRDTVSNSEQLPGPWKHTWLVGVRAAVVAGDDSGRWQVTKGFGGQAQVSVFP